MDERQTQETKDQTLFVYQGGISLDEDMIINENGQEIMLPRGASGVGAIILPIEKSGNISLYNQPYTIIVYQGQQHKVNLRYLHINGEFYDFKEGIEATAFMFPRLDSQAGGRVSKNEIGAAFFISPRLMRGFLAQKYILDDPFNKFPNFKIANVQSAIIIEDLRSRGMQLPEFVYFQGVQGPIKIWDIEYTGEEEMKKEYIDRDYTPYIDWVL